MKKMLVLFYLSTFTFLSSWSQKEVTIGNQVWMVENLNTEFFLNGEKIPKAHNINEWKKAGEKEKPIWCYYNFDDKNAHKYGRFYNWYVVNDKRGIAPKGWHVPSFEEWNLLWNNTMRSTKKSGWILKDNSVLQVSFNIYGGYLYDGDSPPWFYDRGKISYYWSSDFDTELESYIVWSDKERGPSALDRDYSSPTHGLYIKCIKNSGQKIIKSKKINYKEQEPY